MKRTVSLSIAGLGIVLYSPFAVAGIGEGDDYLSSDFWEAEAVAAHVMRGDISTFCTGTGGDFILEITDDSVSEATIAVAEHAVRLCLEVRGGRVFFRDLYDLMDWTGDCPDSQSVVLDDGFYRVTVYTSTPPSGILGDNQRIDVHFQRELEKPRLKWDGIPQLC